MLTAAEVFSIGSWNLETVAVVAAFAVSCLIGAVVGVGVAMKGIFEGMVSTWDAGSVIKRQIEVMEVGNAYKEARNDLTAAEVAWAQMLVAAVKGDETVVPSADVDALRDEADRRFDAWQTAWQQLPSDERDAVERPVRTHRSCGDGPD